MTLNDKLAMMKVWLDDNEADDDSLVAYLNIAGSVIINKAYPYDDTVTEVPKRYDALQCEMAAYLYNKQGAEGQTTHDENGIKRVYESGSIPPSMLSQIVPHVGVIGHAQSETE